MERLILTLCYPIFKLMIKGVFKLDNRDIQEKREKSLLEMFDKVDEALTNHKFICGDELSYIDITFCALSAPLLAKSIILRKGKKSLYGNGDISSFNLSDSRYEEIMSTYPIQLEQFEQKFLERPCGKHVLQVYKDFR